MSKPSRGHGPKPSRLAADLAARLKAVGKRGAQLHVQKPFHPQLTTIMGNIEVARRFAIMHRVVTDPEDVINLWNKRGAISNKGVLQAAIRTFLANAKRYRPPPTSDRAGPSSARTRRKRSATEGSAREHGKNRATFSRSLAKHYHTTSAHADEAESR